MGEKLNEFQSHKKEEREQKCGTGEEAEGPLDKEGWLYLDICTGPGYATADGASLPKECPPGSCSVRSVHTISRVAGQLVARAVVKLATLESCLNHASQ